MKILHLDTERTWRGGEAQVLLLARGLAARGHDCIVAGQPEAPLLDRATGAGLRTLAVSMPSEWSPRAIFELSRWLKKEMTDVIHLHTSHAATLGGLAGRLAGTPVRVISRRVDFSLASNPLRKLKYEWGIDRILAISEGVREVLVADGLNPDRISIVRSGIDPSGFDPEASGEDARRELGIPPDALVIGCVAHFAEHKGHRVLVDAAEMVIRQRPDVRFVLVGDGELKDKVLDQIKNLSIGDNVALPGFRNDVPRLLSAFDVVTLASHLEGLGTSLLDGMVMGRPIVATRVGGIPEIVEDGVTGRLVPAGNPRALADAFLELLENPEARRRMGAAGRTRVLNLFSAGAMVTATESIYFQCLESRRQRDKR